MKTIEERADEYARSQCAGDCALCEDICRMTSVKSAFIAGARSEREEQADIELFEAGAAEYYAQHAFTGNDRAFAERHFKEGAAWMQVELTRWHDPKAEQPESNVCVLLKVADQLGNEAIYLGSRKVAEYVTDGGLVFGTDFDETSMPDMNAKVVGWREIHE